MYSKIGNCAYINGSTGRYDGLIKDNSARYGRNAISNHLDYINSYGFTPISCDTFEKAKTPKAKEGKIESSKDFEEYINSIDKQIEATEKFISDLDTTLSKLPPINFELQYMPESVSGQVDKQALLGASYEELGQRYFISVDEMNRQLNKGNNEAEISADSLDLNNDKRIDIGEYAASILLTDMLSTNENEFSTDNINGKITNKGENALLREYSNEILQYRAYSHLYNYYNLGQAAKDFIKVPNSAVIVVS